MDNPHNFRYTEYMKTLSHLVLSFVTNSFALWGAGVLVTGVTIPSDPLLFVRVAILFTFVWVLVRPLVKLVLGPLIIITFGLGVLVVNALVLYVVAHLTQDFTITGLAPLVYATVLISAVNVVVHVAAKTIYKSE